MFLNKQAEEILSSTLARLVRDTDISVTSAGGTARTLFEIWADQIGNDYSLLDENIQQTFLSTAGGKGLDLLGETFGLTRKTVAGTILANQSNVMFYLSDQARNTRGIASHPAPVGGVTIPAGTIISSVSPSSDYLPVEWKTASNTVIAQGEYMAYADVVPVMSLKQTTPKGLLTYHNFNAPEILDGETPIYVQVYNREDLEIKTTYESDTNFRYRIRYALRTMSSGNAMALRLSALSVNGVRDVKVIPLAEGVGTCKVIVITEQPGTAAGETAFSEASARVVESKSAGDVVFIRRPSEIPVSINSVIFFKQGVSIDRRNSIVENVKLAIYRHINRLSSGEHLQLNKLLHDAMSVSPDISDLVLAPGVGLIVNDTPKPISNYNVGEEEQLYCPQNSVTVAIPLQ